MYRHTPRSTLVAPFYGTVRCRNISERPTDERLVNVRNACTGGKPGRLEVKSTTTSRRSARDSSTAVVIVGMYAERGQDQGPYPPRDVQLFSTSHLNIS